VLFRLVVVSAFFAVFSFVGCSKSDVPENKVFSISDLAKKNVGVIQGTTAEAYASEFGDDSTKMNLKKFSTLAEMVEPLLEGSIDAILSDDVAAKMVVRENSSLQILNESFKEEVYAGVVAKENVGLLDSVNLALIQMRAMGIYDSIFESYVVGPRPYHVQENPANGPVLKIATCAKFPPFEFLDNNKKMVGIDIEIMRYIANHLVRPLEIINMEFENIIESVRQGKADLGFSAFSVSEERSRIINFTDNYATSRIVVIVRNNENGN